jgi:type IV pilus assembly protein PilC
MDIDLSRVKKKKVGKKKEFDLSKILELELGSKELEDSKKQEFYDELGMLLQAGLDIRTSFSILTKEKKAKKIQEFYETVNDRLMGGMSLSEAMNSTGKISSMEYYSIKIGEETGRISEVLNDVAKYYSQKIKWRKQIIGALSYPIMVIVTAMLVILFMVNFIVPLFQDVFKRFSAELLGITKFVLAFSEWMQNNYLYIFLAFAAIFAFYSFNKKKEWYRKYSSHFILKIPLVKDLVLSARISRYCHSMSKMISHQVLILTAIELCSKMTTFYPLQKALEEISKDVEKGALLSASMAKFSFFDLKMISLTKVGEEINQLAGIYEKLSEQYADEFQYKINSINNVLEPTLILVIGGLIALILISMYLPMFQLNNNFM